jgi:diguanylate cyclase (GGDEF)-like protein
VPGVIDCDRVTAYLWRPERGEPVRQAIAATGRGSGEDAGLRSVRPADVPQARVTGAANRTGFQERLAAATSQAPETSVALFYIDLDDFKSINAEHGHDVGDDLLRAVTQRLRERVLAGDTVARLGGDEFAVLVEDIADAHQLSAISDRLEGAFAAPLRPGGQTFAIGASIGRAVWPLDGDDADALLRRTPLCTR